MVKSHLVQAATCLLMLTAALISSALRYVALFGLDVSFALGYFPSFYFL
ncbi:hypothetical protein LINPERHAP1_LOCUS18779, partial [Linum perenne]